MTDTSNDGIINMTDPTKAPLEYELPEPPVDQDEEDVCRVCRLEGDEEMPLIYPCKCSGSVRYVHPDCLKQWLATSGKRACEICDHKYVFTKVYSDYIPSTIPFEVVLRQIARVIFRILYRIARIYFASNAWLLFLPSANMYTLHCLLWAVDTASPRPKANSSTSTAVANETLSDNSTIISSVPLNETRIAVNEIINHPFRTMGTVVRDSWTRWNAGEANTIFGYVFRGQILTVALASVIISIILIREWMTQHNWEHRTPAPESEEGPIDPTKWTFRNGVAYPIGTEVSWTASADGRSTSTPDKSASQAEPNSSGTAGHSAHDEVIDLTADDKDDGWEDTDEQPPADRLPSSQAGPSTPPARPCNADKEGFEKVVSYAAPELMNENVVDKGKGKAADDQAETSSPHAADRDVTTDAGSSDAALPHASISNTSARDTAALRPALSTPMQSNDSGDFDAVDTLPPVARVDLPAVPAPEDMDEAIREILAQAGAARQAPVPDPPAPVPHVHNHAADMDDLDDQPLDIDDWEGLLEVAGLIGPIQNLIQNVLFGFMIMGASLFLLVGGPMWIGRLFLAIDYVRTSFYFSTLVFHGSRLVFGPALRISRDILKEVVVMPALSSFGAFEKIVADSAGLGSTSLLQLNLMPNSIREQGMSKLGDLFALIGRTTHDYATAVYIANRQWSARILVSGTLASRLTTVGVGYAVVGGTLGLLALNPAGTSSNGGETIMQSIKRHSQFVKLSFFMFIELAIFPSGIGFVILCCTTPLLQLHGLEGLKGFVKDLPVGALVTCWLVGTTFMFWFAAVLQKIRKLVRPGVLFFIRDPNERTYNPVKEILERPASSQVRKLGISAVMYIFVVYHLFGAWCWLLGRGPLSGLNILPLRLDSYDALSTVPFDYLALSMLSSPSVIKSFPWLFVRGQLERRWRNTIKSYNLGSLLRYDKVVPPESRSATRVWAVLDVVDQIVLGRYINTTCKARVPASDGIVLLRPEERKGRGVFIRLDQNGSPTNTEDKAMLLRQDKSARDKHRDPQKDYTVVWLPQYWRTRVHALILTTLVTGGFLACAIVTGPLVTGRLMLDRLLPAPAHDGYNWTAGAAALWSLTLIGVRAKKHIIASQRAERIRASTAATRVKRMGISVIRVTGSFSLLFVVLPLLLGIAWELYIAMPIRYGFTAATPVLHVWEAWAMGMVLTFAYAAVMHDQDVHRRDVLLRIVRTSPARRFRSLYRTIRLHRLELNWLLTWPIIARLCVAIVTPTLISIIPAWINQNEWEEHAFSVIYRFTHPVCLVAYLLIAYSHSIARRYRAIRQDLIDAEYVVEERVENYDDKPFLKSKLVVEDADVDSPSRTETAGEETEDEWEDINT